MHIQGIMERGCFFNLFFFFGFVCFHLIALWLGLNLMHKTLGEKWTCDIWNLELFFFFLSFLNIGRAWVFNILLNAFSVCNCWNTKACLQCCFSPQLFFCSLGCKCNSIQCIKKKFHSSMVEAKTLHLP